MAEAESQDQKALPTHTCNSLSQFQDAESAVFIKSWGGNCWLCACPEVPHLRRALCRVSLREGARQPVLTCLAGAGPSLSDSSIFQHRTSPDDSSNRTVCSLVRLVRRSVPWLTTRIHLGLGPPRLVPMSLGGRHGKQEGGAHVLLVDVRKPQRPPALGVGPPRSVQSEVFSGVCEEFVDEPRYVIQLLRVHHKENNHLLSL